MIQVAFKDYTFNVPGRGTIVMNGASRMSFALSGPSGCGKSTLLRSLCGFWPSSGSFLVDGIDQRSLSPQSRGFALVSQRGGLLVGQTVLENLVFALSQRPQFDDLSRSFKEERAMDSLKIIGLDSLAAKLVDHISGGQARRVSLVRALLSEPRALLLDEPFTGLDDESKESMIKFFSQHVATKDYFFILVSHDQSELNHLAVKKLEFSQCIELA